MSGAPAVKDPGPGRPVPGPEDDAAPRSGPRERLWRKAVLRPVVLGTIGLALLLIVPVGEADQS